jgi:outer membrane cobalamin receptor
VVGTDIEVRTGPLGQFAIADVPEGTAWVRVTAEGLPSVREQVDISGDGVVFLQFRMPEDVFAVLDDVNVDVWGAQGPSSEAASALELVAAKVPSISSITSADIGDRGQAIRLRGVSSLTQSGDPLIVVDDIVLRGAPPLELLSQIPAVDVESIEILRGPAAAFRYPFAANGVIAIKTKK